MASEHEPKAAEIVDDIEHELGHSWFFNPETIRVSIAGGVVTLTGKVRSPRERRMAAAAAWAHEGVTDVQNDLEIGKD
jgi:osmotically-inducible protein OsmY